MRIKILHIENSKKVTGSMTALLKLIVRQQDKYCSIIALPKHSKNGIIAKAMSLNFVFFNFIEIRKKVSALMGYIPMLFINAVHVYKFCKKNRIRIIHNNDHYNMVPIIIKFFLGSKIKLITHVRLLPSTYNHQLYGVFRAINHKYADHIVVVSKAVLNAYGAGKNISLIYDSYHLDEHYDKYQVREKSSYRFLYLANYITGKGHEYAIRAFSLFCQVNNNAELHFYGSTMDLKKNQQYKEMLTLLAKQLGIANKIIFYESSNDTEFLYKSYDISLMFSESESFSMICYESLYYGVPVIASDCGGPSELIENNKNGFLVQNRNIEKMAEAMNVLFNDINLRRKFSIKGKEKIIEMMQSNNNFFSVVDSLLN